ncbi:MAG: FliM/FliN family flagellar motor switch protein, partial [Sphingomonas sp.]
MLADFDGDDAMIVTRFGIAPGQDKPAFVDIVYPVSALKPHGTALTGKVVAKAAAEDALWQTALTRAAMNIRFPVRSVLAEPTIRLSKLMSLQPGDVIPISFGQDVPVMVGNDRLGLRSIDDQSDRGDADVRLGAHTRGVGHLIAVAGGILVPRRGAARRTVDHVDPRRTQRRRQPHHVIHRQPAVDAVEQRQAIEDRHAFGQLGAQPPHDLQRQP